MEDPLFEETARVSNRRHLRELLGKVGKEICLHPFEAIIVSDLSVSS